MNYNDASLVITPNGVKAGKLYALKGDDLNVVRATSATRVNASGLIETVGANIPRLDYTNGSCPSILVEPQRTNILLNSETLATQSVSVTAQPYTLSFYGSGTVVLSGTHSATVVGLGTARKTYTFTPTAGTLTLTVTGTCTKGQLEAGSYATSYIPTTSASVTRNADVISKTGISSLIGQTEGTLFLDFVFKTPPLDICGPIGISSADNTNRIGFWNNYTFNSIAIFLRANGINLFNTSVSSLVDGTRYKLAVSYKSGDIRVYLNGTLTNTLTNTFTFSNDISVLYNASFESTSNVHQRTNQITLWKTALTNTQLSELTTI